MYNISRTIKKIVEGLKVKIKTNTITVSGGIVNATTCNTMCVNVGRVLLLNGSIEVIVTSFVENQSFTFRLPTNFDIETLNSIEIKPFHFFNGTATLTNAERDMVKEHRDRTPFVWLYSVYNEDETRNFSRAFEVSADLRLFILDESDFQDWLFEQHEDKVLIPLRSYKEQLIKAIEKSKEVYQIGNTRLTQHANWGKFVEKGHIEKIFSDNLSGLELRFNIQMNYDTQCKC